MTLYEKTLTFWIQRCEQRAEQELKWAQANKKKLPLLAQRAWEAHNLQLSRRDELQAKLNKHKDSR